MAGALALGFVHQLVGALNQVRGEAARDEAALGDASEPQADDADVDAHRLHGEPAILERPVVALDRLAEALADRVRLMILGEVGNEEAELVAAEARVEILAGARAPARSCARRSSDRTCSRSSARHALDDPVADRVAERVVVPLEPGDVDEADGAPAAALLERQERLELLGEAAEVHQLRLRIAVRLVGEIGDQRFEVARDAADGRVLRRQLGLARAPSCRRSRPTAPGWLPASIPARAARGG